MPDKPTGNLASASAAQEPREPPAGPVPPVAGGSAIPHEPLRLWLTFAARLLEPPSLGSVHGIHHGGPWTWCDALLRGLGRPPEVLRSSRQPNTLLPKTSDGPWAKNWGDSPLSVLPLCKWLFSVERLLGHEIESLQRAVGLWKSPAAAPTSRTPGETLSPDDFHALQVALTRAREASRSLPAKSAKLIREFLHEPSLGEAQWERWGAIAELTRALFEDAIARGMGSRKELLDRLRTHLADAASDPSLGAEAMLQSFVDAAKRSAFSFSQELVVAEQLTQALQGAQGLREPYVHVEQSLEFEELAFSAIEHPSDDTDSPGKRLLATGQVLAQDASQARHRATELVS